jgi:DNA polymerase III delta prime subunit
MQSLLLIAPKGSGKRTILTELALDIVKNNSPGNIINLKPENGKNFIGIESIRDLKRSLKLK